VHPTILESNLYALGQQQSPTVLHPSLVAVADQLGHLDGLAFDQLYVEGSMEDGSSFSAHVGDGTGGYCILEIQLDGRPCWCLVGREPSDDEPEWALIHSGGQATDTFTRWVVSVDRAGRGLWFFLSTGHLDPGLRWENLDEVSFEPPAHTPRLRLPRRA
jgi:hypothetical protein